MSKLVIERGRKLAGLTTFRIGGNADYFCEPDNLDQLFQAFEFIRENKSRYYILGGGSNTLFSDNGFPGIIISMSKLSGVSRKGETVIVLAGTSMDELNSFCCREGLSGLEFTGGLPGSAGGAVYMNARAYGNEMSHIVAMVTAYDLEGKKTVFSNKELEYSYKKSVFMNRTDLFLYEIEINLKPFDADKVRDLTEKNLQDRSSKGQFLFPSAGCVYKNDYSTGTPSGQLIDSLGLKGRSVGDACVYDKHANFIVNKGKAKASEVVRLMEEIEAEVLEKKGIKLDREIRLVK